MAPQGRARRTAPLAGRGRGRDANRRAAATPPPPPPPPPRANAAVAAGLTRPERALGRSASNFAVGGAAAELARVFRLLQGLPPVMSAQEEMAGDNARAYFNRYCRFLSSRVIPKNFDENLMPRNPENKQKLVTSTLLLYIGNHLLQIRRLYPDHPDWKDDDPAWWSEMRDGFKKECDSFQQKFSGDAVFGMGDINPLYRCINDPPLPINNDRIDDYVSAIDLRYLLRKLASEATIAGNKRCLERAMVGMTYHCIGRGGEIKFQNFNDWNWDPLLTCVDPRWHEIKIIDTYPMPIVPDREYWETDVYHQLACYFSVEDGLFRSSEQVSSGLLNTVFPTLNASADSYVARRISTIIRRTMPMGCPDSVAASYTARSVRKGAITDLSMHSQMNTLRIAARSGHSTGCTIDSYLDKNNPARCLHAAVAAAGWKNVDNPVAPYRLEAIGNAVETAEFTKMLFACSIPYFNLSGKLHIVLKTCAASMIMYHPRVGRDLGANAISHKVRTAARAAKIKDHRFPNLSPELVINEWAKMIEQDFKQRNKETAPIGQDAASISTGVASVLAISQQMSSVLADLKRSHEVLVLENASGKARISCLEDEVSRLTGHLHHANHKLSQLRTPEKAASPRNQRPVDDVVTVSPPTELSTVTESVHTRLQYSAVASELSSKSKKDGKHTETDRGFANTILALANSGVLRVPFSITTLGKGYHEAHHLKHCFQLADFIGCKEEKKSLMSGEGTDRLQAARDIEVLCSNKLLEFEGKDPNIEKKNKRSRKKATYIAFGGRIQAYKARIMNAEGDDNAGGKKKSKSDVPFMEVDDLRRLEAAANAGATPANQRISRYFRPPQNAPAAKRRRLEASQDRADGIGEFGI